MTVKTVLAVFVCCVAGILLVLAQLNVVQPADARPLGRAGGWVVPLKPRLTRRLTAHPVASFDAKAGAAVGPKVVPLKGNLTYWGEYFAYVGLGTPPQYLQLQVDTGSTDLVVYTPGCYGCPNTTYLSYDQSKSSSGSEVDCQMTDTYTCQNQCEYSDTCNWQDTYGDGSSISGAVYTDLFTVDGLTTESQVSIGGILQSTVGNDGFEPAGVDGIWGFAFTKLSGWGGASVFSIMTGDFNWYEGFSMCLQQSGGVLSLGVDYSKDPRFKWTDLTDEVWYVIAINDIKFGNKSIGVDYYYLNDNQVIVDSGTTLIIVSTDIYAAMRKTLLSFCSQSKLVGICGVASNMTLFDDQCYQMNASQVAAFPSLSINFPGIGDLPILNSDYLWQGAGIPGYYCLGIQAMDSVPVIIGDVFLQRYHVAFDKNNDKIGFGPLSSCPAA